MKRQFDVEMKRQIVFEVSDTEQLAKRVIDYFKQFGFKLIDETHGGLKFGHSSTLFELWKANPLKWGSEISILLTGNKITADFCVETDAQMNSIEEEVVWDTFIEGFQTHMTKGADVNAKVHTAIINNRKTRMIYFIWIVIVAVLVSVLFDFIYYKLTNNETILTSILAAFMAVEFQKWIIKYRKKNYALEQRFAASRG